MGVITEQRDVKCEVQRPPTSMLSSFMDRRKQDESWGRQVPALKRVGDA